MKTQLVNSKLNCSLKGQSVVELAILFPLLLLILIGILDLGRLMSGYVVMTNAAREGARYGAKHSTATTAEIKTRVKNEAQGWNLQDDEIFPSYPDVGGNAAGNRMQVNISYNFKLITTYLFAGLQTIPINTSATFQIE